ncbi:MAG: hypothetical protein ABJB40_11705 [Acidobacteriota bacterium]
MKQPIALNTSVPVRPFRFESYGVKIEINGSHQEIVDEAAAVAKRSLVNEVRHLKGNSFDHHFELNRTKSGIYVLNQNGSRISSGRSRKKFFNYFDSIIRVTVGEHAVDRVFLHAGVVGWKGKAIIIPGDSFRGKTTLVAELVRKGASYYSDEYAILDKNGLVYPFARPLSMRTTVGRVKTYELTVEDLGGTYGKKPIPVGFVLLTGYKPNKKWRPRMLSTGKGVLGMIPFTLPIRTRPELSVMVLNKVASSAAIASGARGSAEEFAEVFFKFLEKHLN